MNESPSVPDTHRLIRLPEVLNICGISRATLYREIKAQVFPAPIHLSTRSVGWVQDEVMQWVESRIKQRANQRKPR